MSKARDIADLGSNDVIETTASGVDVTGTVSADGLVLEGADGIILNQSATGTKLRFNNIDQTVADEQQLARIEFSTDDAGVTTDEIYLQATATGGGGAANFDIMVGDGTPVRRARFDINGDVSFYEDTGTTAKFVWDSSAEVLNIGGLYNEDAALAVCNDGEDTLLRFGSLGTNNYGNSVKQRFQGRSSGGNAYYGDIFFNPENRKLHLTAYHVNTDALVLDSSGNVGIGTASPASKLELSGIGTGVWLTLDRQDTNTNIIDFTETGTRLGYVGYVGDNLIINNSKTSSTTFNIANAEKMRLDSSGNLLVGTTDVAPLAGVSGMVVEKPTAGIAIKSSSGVGQAWLTYVPASTGNLSWFDSTGATGVRMYLSASGSLYNSTGSYGTISDRKLKQNISDASSQWDDIKAVKFKNYKLKADVSKYGEDAPTMLGVIAQDIEDAGMGGLIDETYMSSSDADGNIIEETEKTKTVKYSILYMKAVKALQEAMERIEQLETRIETLETAE